MTLPLYPNSITALQIQTEFGGANPISLSEYYAGGSRVEPGSQGFLNGSLTTIPSSGPISYGHFHGSQQTFYFYDTISTDTVNYNAQARALLFGWNGYSLLFVRTTVNSGVKVIYMYSGEFTSRFQRWNIYNYGTIMARGGSGGAGASLLFPASGNGERGNPAIVSQTWVVIANYGSILGGGGGGGGGGAIWADWRSNPSGAYSSVSLTGGGGGGGASTFYGNSSSPVWGAAGSVSGSFASAQYIIYSTSGGNPADNSTTGGAGGTNSVFGTTYYDPTDPKGLVLSAGAGGAGGNAGEDGADGGYATATNSGATGWFSTIPRDPGLGGWAGQAVYGASTVNFIDPTLGGVPAIGDVRGGIAHPSNGYNLYSTGSLETVEPRTGWYSAFIATSVPANLYSDDPNIVITFNSNGTITTSVFNTVSTFGLLTGNNAFWYAKGTSTYQPTPDIGQLFYIKYTGGITVSNPASTLSGIQAGVWYRLNTARAIQIRRLRSSTGATDASFNFSISTERSSNVLQTTVTARVTVT